MTTQFLIVIYRIASSKSSDQKHTCLVFASFLGECSKYVHFDMPIRGLPILALNRIGCHSYFGFFVSFSKARAHTCVELLLLSGSTYKCTFWIEQIKWAGAHRTHYSRGVTKVKFDNQFFLSRMKFDIHKRSVNVYDSRSPILSKSIGHVHVLSNGVKFNSEIDIIQFTFTRKKIIFV